MMLEENESADSCHDYYTIPEGKSSNISENNNFHFNLLWIECIAEELTGTLGIYPEITWPVSILRPDVVPDEMIPRPKIAWSPCRKVTFGKSLLQFSRRRRIIWLKSFPNLSPYSAFKRLPLCDISVHT